MTTPTATIERRIAVELEAGVRVAGVIGRHRVVTDQPPAGGGSDSAPAPFDLFLVSLATCAGLYAARFLDARGLDRAGLAVELVERRDAAEPARVAELELRLTLPEGFPGKYREAITRAVDQCAVKRHLDHPPRLTTVLVD